MNSQRIVLLEKYILEEPDNPFNYYALAMEYYEYQPEQATIILAKLAEQHPDYLPTYFKLAHLHWEVEQWEQADIFFQKGIALAEELHDAKALQELKSAYQNFQFEKE